MKQLFTLLFAVIFFAACTAPIDIDTDDSEPVIVIMGTVTDSLDYQTVKISSSAPYFDNKPNPAISNAEVTISSSAGDVFHLKEDLVKKGVYRTKNKIAGTPNLTYTLNVKIDFDNDGVKETYSAISTMPENYKVDSIRIKYQKFVRNNAYTVLLYAKNPPQVEYFLCKYYVNDSLVTDRIKKYDTKSNDFLNGDYINGILMYSFRDIEDIDDYDEEDKKDIDFVKQGDIITLHMGRVEQGYFDFINQAQSELMGENPFFGGPASNIISNISGNSVGYFATYGTKGGIVKAVITRK